MASQPLQDFIRRLRRSRSVTEGGHLTDAQLLERFAQHRDEAAFEVLVWRHGTLVLNVARRVLHQATDAEDVFQATFLTLARKAGSIRRGTSVGSWLFKVAYRLALRARQGAATRRSCPQQSHLDTLAAPPARDDADLDALLVEEVNRLPERFRSVVVLCYLQGITTEEAARLVDCPRGTVLSRLAAARQRLRKRLVQRGLAPAAALVAASVGNAASASPSATLVTAVVAASLPFAAGGALVPIVSPQAAALAQGALHTMMWTKIKIITMIACVLAVVGTGSGWLTRDRRPVVTSLPAAEPQPKQEGLPAVAPIRAEDHQKALLKVQKEMMNLEEKEQLEERRFSDALVKARLNLLESQDEEKWQDEMFNFERERRRSKLQAIRDIIRGLEQNIEDFAAKIPNDKDPEITKRTNQLAMRKATLEKQAQEIEDVERKLFLECRASKREIRQKLIQAEEQVRLLETQQAHQRELFAAQRERLQARLQQLEDQPLVSEPSDRLREVERKLDRLRREVGELRRTLERSGNDNRKKP